MNGKVKRVFSPKLMLFFRNTGELSYYLVRAKIHPIERSAGSFKCGKTRCKLCHNANETENFTSSVTLKTYKINHRLNCDDKRLIYFLMCKKCFKQYVTETTEIFCKSWNNNKNNARSS